LPPGSSVKLALSRLIMRDLPGSKILILRAIALGIKCVHGGTAGARFGFTIAR
jgi:hypothetical protein